MITCVWSVCRGLWVLHTLLRHCPSVFYKLSLLKLWDDPYTANNGLSVCAHQKQFPVSPPPQRRKGDSILPTSTQSICHVHHTQCNKTYNGGNPVTMMREVVWITVQVAGRSIVINCETPGWSRQNTGIRRRYGITGPMQMLSFYIVGCFMITFYVMDQFLHK